MIISLKNLDDEKWLPDVISAMIEKDIGLSISAESIYSYIYNSDKSKSLELYKLLPQRRFIRLKHGSSRTRTTILGRQSIHSRDSVGEDKTESGHFEGDLTFSLAYFVS